MIRTNRYSYHIIDYEQPTFIEIIARINEIKQPICEVLLYDKLGEDEPDRHLEYSKCAICRYGHCELKSYIFDPSTISSHFIARTER